MSTKEQGEECPLEPKDYLFLCGHAELCTVERGIMDPMTLLAPSLLVLGEGSVASRICTLRLGLEIDCVICFQGVIGQLSAAVALREGAGLEYTAPCAFLGFLMSIT